MNISNILYVGAGAHLDPLLHFSDANITMVDMLSEERLARSNQWDTSLRHSPRLTYLFDVHLPTDFDKIAHLTNAFDTLIVSGHYPSNCVKSLLTSQGYHFVGYSRTWYPQNLKMLEEDEEDGEIDTIMSDVIKSALSFTYVDILDNKKTTFSTYDEFYKHYMSTK